MVQLCALFCLLHSLSLVSGLWLIPSSSTNHCRDNRCANHCNNPESVSDWLICKDSNNKLRTALQFGYYSDNFMKKQKWNQPIYEAMLFVRMMGNLYGSRYNIPTHWNEAQKLSALAGSAYIGLMLKNLQIKDENTIKQYSRSDARNVLVFDVTSKMGVSVSFGQALDDFQLVKQVCQVYKDTQWSSWTGCSKNCVESDRSSTRSRPYCRHSKVKRYEDCGDPNGGCGDGSKATCNPQDGSCSCKMGWSGSKCKIDINECSSSPCANGKCTDRINGYTCSCDKGYKGINCLEDIDECKQSTSLCFNNGKCINNAGGFSCKCAGGFNGARCQNNIDECASSPCVFGSCTDGIDRFECKCTAGYTGQLCDVEIDECNPNPCVNGACNDAVNSFYCFCFPGYIGKICDQACKAGKFGAKCVSDCECQQDESCHHVTGICQGCAAGWMGPKCATACGKGRYGNGCKKSCLCQNGGLCNKFDGSCSCVGDYSGKKCEIDPSVTISRK